MAPRCKTPKAVAVMSYLRTGPRKKPKAPVTYYECHSRSGRWCGTKHRTITAAAAHARRLDKLVRRKGTRSGGRLDLWSPEKRGR